MAIGNLFDNTRHNPPSWRAWSGDVSFRKEDIDYLVKEFNRKKEKSTKPHSKLLFCRLHCKSTQPTASDRDDLATSEKTSKNGHDFLA